MAGAREPSYARLPQTRAAIAYAERMHADQIRGDGTPFILHPLEVASLLYYAGAPDHVIAAGVMHDLIEKAGASESDLQQRFGPRITRLVLAVSDDDRIHGYAKRKAALRHQVAGAGQEALELFAADKLSRVRELRRETALDPDHPGTPGGMREPTHPPPETLPALAGVTGGAPGGLPAGQRSQTRAARARARAALADLDTLKSQQIDPAAACGRAGWRHPSHAAISFSAPGTT